MCGNKGGVIKLSEKWYVEVDGETVDLEKLVAIQIKTKFQFIKIQDRFFIRSGSFNDCEYIEDVLKQGEEIIKVINGISEVNLGLNSKIRILGATIIDEEVKNIVKNYREDCFNATISIRTELNDESKPENSMENWIELSEIDENIRKVFRLLNYGLDSFVNMYRIYEIIRNDLGKSYLKILEIDKSEIDRFTGSANRPDASGELARHGYLPGEPMKQPPMRLGEANNFVYEMIYKWIHYKLEAK